MGEQGFYFFWSSILTHALEICISNVSLWASYRNYYFVGSFIDEYEAKCDEVKLGVVWIISKANVSSEMVFSQSDRAHWQCWRLKKVFTYSTTVLAQHWWESFQPVVQCKIHEVCNVLKTKFLHNVGSQEVDILRSSFPAIRHSQFNSRNLEEKRTKVGQT